jgi:hypothetical protein
VATLSHENSLLARTRLQSVSISIIRLKIYLFYTKLQPHDNSHISTNQPKVRSAKLHLPESIDVQKLIDLLR